jgi:L-fuconolactonase
MEPRESQMREVANHPNVYCKLSGMVTETDHHHWKPSDFKAYIQHILDIFDPNRVMFGSNWPVCLLAADYGQVVDVLTQAIPESWTQQEIDQLFGLNTKRFYKL